jgi:hypothetical protein
LETDRFTIVWPPIATLGGVSRPPDPILSSTTKCGVDSGGCVCVWRAALADLVFVAVVLDDELDAAEVELDALRAGAVELAGDDAVPEPAFAGAAALADELVEVEWPPDPHAATSSAVTSAATARRTIGPA